MKLKYISWADNTGYATAAKSYLRAFQKAGIDVIWAPMLPGKRGYEFSHTALSTDTALACLVKSQDDYDVSVIHTVPEYFPGVLAEERRRRKRVVGYTVWETEALPDHWPALINQLDAVIVPCHWNVEIFRRSGVTVPIHVVPHLSQFAPLTPASMTDGNWLPTETSAVERFMFYTIGHWSARKAPSLVVEAFLQAFKPEEPVSLLIKTGRNDVTRQHRSWRNGFRLRFGSPRDALARQLKAWGATPPISLVCDEDLTDDQMLALHRRGDCFVSLARSEGWGLGAFDAAMLGNPVVMTGYGGQLDFLDPALAHLVDYRMVPVDEPIWRDNYRATDRWAEPEIEHAAKLMRWVFEHRDEAGKRAATLSSRLATQFSEEAIISAWKKALD